VEFTKQNFTLYEPEELNDLLEQHGFKVIREETNRYEKEAADGNPVKITDICVLTERK
jgi:hypothetical protein